MHPALILWYPGPPMHCRVIAVVCVVKEIENSTFFRGKGGNVAKMLKNQILLRSVSTLLLPIVACNGGSCEWVSFKNSVQMSFAFEKIDSLHLPEFQASSSPMLSIQNNIVLLTKWNEINWNSTIKQQHTHTLNNLNFNTFHFNYLWCLTLRRNRMVKSKTREMMPRSKSGVSIEAGYQQSTDTCRTSYCHLFGFH